MEDSRIIALLFERSEQALTALSGKYGPAVMALAGHILGNRLDAEECANDTWMGAWNSVPPQYPAHLKAYTLAIARNLALDRYHANSAQKRNSFYDVALDELAECLSAPAGVEAELEARELAAAINRFLATLPKADRQMFLCRYYLADPVSLIAAKLNMKGPQVSLRLFRLREKLRKFLEKEGLSV